MFDAELGNSWNIIRTDYLNSAAANPGTSGQVDFDGHNEESIYLFNLHSVRLRSPKTSIGLM